jgi:hypothetical protein
MVGFLKAVKCFHPDIFMFMVEVLGGHHLNKFKPM